MGLTWPKFRRSSRVPPCLSTRHPQLAMQLDYLDAHGENGMKAGYKGHMGFDRDHPNYRSVLSSR